MCIVCALQAAAAMMKIDGLMTAAEAGVALASATMERAPEDRRRIVADMLSARNDRKLTVENVIARFMKAQENDYRPVIVKDKAVYFFNPVTETDEFPWTKLPLPSEEMHAEIAADLEQITAEREGEAGKVVSSFMEKMSSATH